MQILSLTSCVTWDKLFNLSGPQFPAYGSYKHFQSLTCKALVTGNRARHAISIHVMLAAPHSAPQSSSPI